MNGLVVLLILGMASASLAADCNALSKIKVKHQWTDVYGANENREVFATAVWRNFFEHHSDRSLFKNVHGDNIYSAEFRAHMVRVFAGLDILISVLDDEGVFNSASAHYAEFHKQFGGIPFDEFGVALRDTLPDFIHEHYDQDAWSQCYNYIISHLA